MWHAQLVCQAFYSGGMFLMFYSSGDREVSGWRDECHTLSSSPDGASPIHGSY